MDMHSTPKSQRAERIIVQMPNAFPQSLVCIPEALGPFLFLCFPQKLRDAESVHSPAGSSTASNRQQQQQQPEVCHCSKMPIKMGSLGMFSPSAHPAKTSAMSRTSPSLVKMAGMPGGSRSHLVHCSASIATATLTGSAALAAGTIGGT